MPSTMLGTKDVEINMIWSMALENLQGDGQKMKK